MDVSHLEYPIQERSFSVHNTLKGIRKVFHSDPAPGLQLLLLVVIVSAGIVLQLNALQWTLISIVSLVFLVTGIFRTAALLQIQQEPMLSPFQASRIKWMGNGLVSISAGISLLTYLLIFIPKITQLL